jgi:FixJ family two-component response regulator
MREAGFTTFLVDDDPAVLKAITRLLNAAGYRTRSFSSPQEFLSAHDPSIPGCAIIDLVMSELDGLHLQQALLETGSERPIIFLSGKGDVVDQCQSDEGGCGRFPDEAGQARGAFFRRGESC